MQIYHTIHEWRVARQSLPAHRSIGFVPTMGNLHLGHASLFNTCRQENDYSVASLFVNPTQFNQASDFTHYPRTVDDDLALLENLGIDYCLLPNEKAMYPDGYRFQLDEIQYSNQMEGLHRPGHFKGVLTVVMKLLNLVNPDRAYFGEKDYMQLQLIRDMAHAFFMNTEIKSCPTIRETSGLAYSSRNARLTPEARQLANQFATIFHQTAPCDQIISELQAIGVEVEYIEEHDGRRFAAVIIGGIRLIDNIATDPK